MISVIVLTYNQEAYIRQTLDSILLQQVDEPVEIIIGDDHSVDSTSTICRDYQAHHPECVRYFYNEHNLGLVQNFVAMLHHCKGEYIALCDGDDYWMDRQKLQKQVQVMRADSRCVLVHTNRQLLAEQLYEQPSLDNRIAENPLELFFHPYICVPTTMFRARPVLAWLDTYERLSQQQDWRMLDFPLWLYLGTQGTFRYLPDNTAVYRVLPNTLSREQEKCKRYRFDSSVMRIKQYFYPLYYKNSNNRNLFRRDFKEMEFHTRKRMILDYGWVAYEQIVPMLRLLPWLPMIVWRRIYRSVVAIGYVYR